MPFLSSGTKMLEQLNKELTNKTNAQNVEINKMQKKLERILNSYGQNTKQGMEPALKRNKTEVDKQSEGSGRMDEYGKEDNNEADGTHSESGDESKLRHDRSRKKRFRSPEEIDRMTKEMHDTNEDENVAEEIGVSQGQSRFGIRR